MAKDVARQFSAGSFVPHANRETGSIWSQAEDIERRIVVKTGSQSTAYAVEGLAHGGSVAYLLVCRVGAQ